MAGKGGKRPGAGRPTVAKELATADLARDVLIQKFGGLKEALIALLEMNEPALTKFVFEHAFGKSPDKIEIGGKDGGPIQITGMEIVGYKVGAAKDPPPSDQMIG